MCDGVDDKTLGKRRDADDNVKLKTVYNHSGLNMYKMALCLRRGWQSIGKNRGRHGPLRRTRPDFRAHGVMLVARQRYAEGCMIGSYGVDRIGTSKRQNKTGE